MGKKMTIGAKPTGKSTHLEDWVSGGNPETETREPMKRLTIDVPLGLHAQIKSQCALRGVKMADEIRAILEAHFMGD